MGGRLVYAIVPIEKTGTMVEKRAKVKATQLVGRTNLHMALESQTLDAKGREYEIRRIQQELLDSMPSDLWDDV